MPSAVRPDTAFTANTLAGNDDGSTGAVAIGFTLGYFGNNYSDLYVNNNGNVTFGGARSAFTPTALSGLAAPTRAPFWADVDTRASGTSPVTYGAGTVNGRGAFGVNWVDVG